MLYHVLLKDLGGVLVGFVNMWSEDVVKFIEEIELGGVVDFIEIGEYQLHLLYLEIVDVGLPNSDATTFAHFNHLFDVHERIRLAFVEYIQGMLTNVFGNAVGNLSLLRLANEPASHLAESVLHVGYSVPLEEVGKWLR
jgi:hypothetical protein